MTNAETYRPNDATLAALAAVDLIGIVGPTAGGKTTLMAAALAIEPRLHVVPSSASRARRPGETEVLDRRFVSAGEMAARIAAREYVQVVPGSAGDHYATALEDYWPDSINVMNIWASAIGGFRSLPFRHFQTIYIAPPSFEVWQERWRRHGLPAGHEPERRREAAESFEFAASDPEVVIVMNDDLMTARDGLLAIMHGSVIDEVQQHMLREHVADLRQQLVAGS